MFVNQINIKKRTLTEWSALVLFLLPFAYSFLTELLSLPNVIKFISDFLIFVSIVVIAYRSSKEGILLLPKTSFALSMIVVLFFLYVLAGYVLNYQSVFYFLWGVRNNFRFYLAFFAFVLFIKEGDAKKCLKLVDYFFWLHAIVTLIQYFGFGYNQDYLGGLFGVTKGCNGYVIVFISIVTAKALLSYMNGHEKAVLCFSKCAIALLLSALAELKFFIVIFVLILTLATIVTRFSTRKFIIILFSFLMISVAYTILIMLFDHFSNFLSFDYLVNELFRENYASSEDVGRFTSIPIISERFLTTFPERLLGMGIGNCDTSAISIFNTAFYDRYVDIHYSVFSVSFLFLETGFIGLTIFISFFVVSLTKAIKALKRKTGNLLFNQMGLVMSILCFILMFYNSSLRTEAGYMVYFVLALPFIGMNNSDSYAPAAAVDIEIN